MKIGIIGHDCRDCSYAAYLAVCSLEGGERAVSSFHDGFVTVWINPAKTNRAALEKALTGKKVKLNSLSE